MDVDFWDRDFITDSHNGGTPTLFSRAAPVTGYHESEYWILDRS